MKTILLKQNFPGLRETGRVRPEDHQDIGYWSRKWGVSRQEVHDAILHTGSVNASTLKEYVKRNSWLYHPVDATVKLFKGTINYIF